MGAYDSGRCPILYDPRLGRVAFIIRDSKGQIVDGTGRALSKYSKPKWYRYARSKYPLIVPGAADNKVSIIVEDAVSACAVSEDYTGIALLGTSLSVEFIKPILQFDKVIIALDKDASHKAITLQRYLSPFCSVTVRLLEKDLKYLTREEIRKVIEREI